MKPIIQPNLTTRPGDVKISYTIKLYSGLVKDLENLGEISGSIRLTDVIRHALNELIDKQQRE
jgi:hypothetical protein